MKKWVILQISVMFLAMGCGGCGESLPTNASAPNAIQSEWLDMADLYFEETEGPVPQACVQRREGIMVSILPKDEFSKWCDGGPNVIGCYRVEKNLIVIQQDALWPTGENSEGFIFTHEYMHLMGGCAFHNPDAKHENSHLFWGQYSVLHRNEHYMQATGVWSSQ